MDNDGIQYGGLRSMTQEHMRLTREQRIAALERENVVLRDKMELLHAMLKQQRQIIKEYIVQQITRVEGHQQGDAASASSGAHSAFVCRRRFEQMEQRLETLEAGAHERSRQRLAV